MGNEGALTPGGGCWGFYVGVVVKGLMLGWGRVGRAYEPPLSVDDPLRLGGTGQPPRGSALVGFPLACSVVLRDHVSIFFISCSIFLGWLPGRLSVSRVSVGVWFAASHPAQ